MSDGAERANTLDLHVIYHRQPTNMTSHVNTRAFPSLDTSENTFFCCLLCCIGQTFQKTHGVWMSWDVKCF